MLVDFEALDGWLAARCGRPIDLPPGFTPAAGLRDPSHMLVHGVPGDAIDLGGIVVALSYVDVEGGSSDRMVRFRRAWRTVDDGYVTAYCELRSEPRTFRFSGMRQIIEATTGEIITDIPAWFDELGVRETDPNLRAMWQSIRQGTRVLMALAVADGQLVADEVQQVVLYADRRAEDFGVFLTEQDHKRIEAIARRLRPDLDTAREALREVTRDPGHTRQIVRAMRALSVADDVVCAAEEAFMREVSGH